MRWLMRYMVVSMVVSMVVMLASCDFDHLYYETNRLSLVRIDVDWELSQTTPNGVSAYVYDASGDLYDQELSSDPNVIYMKLPVGSYTVVIHNNSISELNGVELIGMNRLESASIYATERSDAPAFDVEGEPIPFVNEPCDVICCTLRDVVVAESDVNYHYYKPDVSESEQVAHRYSAQPKHVVHISRVILHLSGLESAQGAPVARLSGMSGGYRFDAECTCDGDVMEEFSVNTRISKTDDTADDTIFIDYNTFGMHLNDPKEQRYFLDLHFFLVDGSEVDYFIEITDDIRTEITQGQNLHTIELYLDPLPNVDGDSPGSTPSGGYTPSTDPWVEVEVDLEM